MEESRNVAAQNNVTKYPMVVGGVNARRHHDEPSMGTWNTEQQAGTVTSVVVKRRYVRLQQMTDISEH